MQEPFFIKKIAVLGAGVMGAQIAAHCVNAGIETLLFDLPADGKDHNAIVNQSILNLAKLKPAPLATPQYASLLKARNYQDDLAELIHCDLIIEAIAEKLDLKEKLYQKIAPFLSEKTVVVSNTSGLSINTLAGVLPEAHQRNFCGVHFFNPPRYMHLAELIPHAQTSPLLLDHLESWLTSHLGKGVIRTKDTPNFIANRIGVFSLIATIHHAQRFQLRLDTVDALTGTLLLRPKSATFRTMDVVGLDTMAHVIKTMEQQLQFDPWHPIFVLPDWLMELIKEGHLGQKTGQGIYRKKGHEIEVYDMNTRSYQPTKGEVSEEVKAIMRIKHPQERFEHLLKAKHPEAEFLLACFRDLFHYSAFHLQDIAHSVRDVDLAMRWGFGWQHGPFETWQAAGVTLMKECIETGIVQGHTLSSAKLPAWLTNLNDFYQPDGAYSPHCMSYVGQSKLPVYQRQYFSDKLPGESQIPVKTIYENDGVSLFVLPNEVAVVSFKTKANTIGQSVLDGLHQVIDMAEKNGHGLIMYQHDPNQFSSGANLKEVLELINAQKWSALDTMISQFQQLAMRIKYSAIPVITALRGRALGGGCELMMQSALVVSAFESYPGLVEAGVGLIPAGGGCKEMALRAADKAEGSDFMVYVEPYFKQIAKAEIASSAPEALQKGYLQQKDVCVMHRHEVLFAAVTQLKSMMALNYQPPISRTFRVGGREDAARLQIGLTNWLEGGFISKHDYFLASQLAWVLCGGDVNEGTLVDEAWMLHLEKTAFMTLAQTQMTEARIKYLLETGKPLRN